MLTLRNAGAAAIALIALSILPSPALAQAPAARNTAYIADSVALAGDSAAAYAMLEDAVRREKKNAAAWHQLGLMSWNMAKAKRSGGFISDKRTVNLLIVADSALRLSTQFAPDSARYWLSLARFNLTSGVATMHAAATGQAGHALEAARRVGDSLLIAAAADEVGMATWRRWEPVAKRALDPTGAGVSLASIQRGKAADYLRSIARRIEPPTGQADYSKAYEQFRTAAFTDRTSQRYSRHLYMALGEQNRWEEMRQIARQRVSQFPLDFQSWQALGLALHRLNDEKAATVAFDSASLTMDDAERERMTRFTRILRPVPKKDRNGKDIANAAVDARAYTSLAEGLRRGLEAMFWMMSDPLALTNENEFQLEFLSRVVYADLRFSNEDLNIRGADTDRGDVYVRYGPPVHELTIGASSNQSINHVTIAWLYSDDLTFFFDLVPGFATAKTLFDDKDYVERVKTEVPVRWDNVPSTKLLDTIPIRIARFRAGRDSIDAVVAARVPIDSLVRGLGMDRVPVDVDFRLFDQFVKVRGVESQQTSFSTDSATQPLPRTWVRRLGPGINVVRVEAMQMDSKRAARAMTRIDPDRTEGFGMSDVLLGSKPSLKDESRPAGRWRDVNIVPNEGTFAAGSSIGMLWEMYDITPKDGQAKYRLSVAVDRVDRKGVGRIAARLVDGIGRTLGREQSGRNNLTISFDRAVAAAPTLVEFLSLDLSEASPGVYRLRVEVTDMANQSKTARLTEFQIR